MSDNIDNLNNPNPSDMLPANIEDLLHKAYLQYSLSVNVGRAIPDVRDGLKPGMRRVLYVMRKNNLTKGGAYRKCATVVGDVIGKYHPHGDSSVYDTLVRMAQDFSMRYTLVDGQGNFGSIDGDRAAAYRYTECRMERLAEEMLADIDKDTVDMAPNFDDSAMEPTVLPARYPNLLVNGTMGIGVGMATSIPPHNLTEIISGTVAVLDNPAIGIGELMEHVTGPDFPTGGTIMGLNSIRSLYETGRGSIYLRGKAEIIEKDDKETIIIREIPYAVNKENLVKKIADLVKNQVITGIAGLNDESSSRAGIRVVVTVKRGAMASVVLNQLFKHTQLATSIGCQFLVVDKNRPRTMNLKQVLQAYLDHRLDVITRRIEFELEKAQKRAHVLEGLKIAVQNIDKVIQIIRSSRTRDDAHDKLAEQFKLTRRQTSAILDMRLSQLTGLAIEDLENEYQTLVEQIAHYKDLLAHRAKRLAVVREELVEVKEKYGDERRTNIQAGSRDINIEDLIARQNVTITISNEGYIKRVPTNTYRTQNRGGKGVTGMTTKEDDFVKHIINASSHDYILFFTNHGRMHWIKGFNIPEASRQSKGKAMINLLEFEEGESVRAIIGVDNLDVEDRYIVMATHKGKVKKTRLNAFKHLRKKPIKAIVLKETDDLIEAKLTDGQKEIIISTKKGIACRFKEADARPLGRVSQGVRGIRLKENDKVVAMSIVEEDEDIIVVTAKGMGKRSRVGAYRLTKRGGKGVRNIKLKEDDYVVDVLRVDDSNDLLMTTFSGMMVRISLANIRTIGRASQGVTIMKFKKKADYIIGISRIEAEEEEEVEFDEEGNPIVKEEVTIEDTESTEEESSE